MKMSMSASWILKVNINAFYEGHQRNLLLIRFASIDQLPPQAAVFSGS
jgi:hypothetical protein